MSVSPYLSGGLLGFIARRKVFVSYYHNADQAYRDYFERAFGHIFISKSVKPGDISTDLSTDYIRGLIHEGYISDTSVIIVLVGSKTWCRKHVDWEISAGLSKKVGGYSGLIGVLLPSFPLQPGDQYRYDDLPARLADNARSGYADIYTWNWITASEQNLKNAIQTAFDARISRASQIDNRRLQLGRNLSG
jgi:hypothetical protein